MLRKIWAVALLNILDGMRRYAIIGLVLLTLALECGGLLFMDFIPQDIGRASGDFILTVGWFAGLLFLLFHCVQAMAWDEGRRTIHTLLARPISRAQYVLGSFSGLALLLLLLNLILGGLGYGVLLWIKASVKIVYFPLLDLPNYLLAWGGLYAIELMLLAVIMLLSGLVRGSFPVLLLATCYTCICNALPVVRHAYRGSELNQYLPIDATLKWLTAIFPDFSRFDHKSLITEKAAILWQNVLLDGAVLLCFVALVLALAAMIYQRRDLK